MKLQEIFEENSSSGVLLLEQEYKRDHLPFFLDAVTKKQCGVVQVARHGRITQLPLRRLIRAVKQWGYDFMPLWRGEIKNGQKYENHAIFIASQSRDVMFRQNIISLGQFFKQDDVLYIDRSKLEQIGTSARKYAPIAMGTSVFYDMFVRGGSAKRHYLRVGNNIYHWYNSEEGTEFAKQDGGSPHSRTTSRRREGWV